MPIINSSEIEEWEDTGVSNIKNIKTRIFKFDEAYIDTLSNKQLVHDIDEIAKCVLTPREKEIYIALYRVGLSVEEIAKKIGVTRGRIYVLSDKLLFKLRREIEKVKFTNWTSEIQRINYKQEE